MADSTFLFDHPVDYYRHGCTTDSKFDPDKALALGYSEAQLPAIEQFLAGEDVGVPAPEPKAEPEPAEELDYQG